MNSALLQVRASQGALLAKIWWGGALEHFNGPGSIGPQIQPLMKRDKEFKRDKELARERNSFCLFHFLSSDSVRKKKRETSWPTCWKSSRELRRMAGSRVAKTQSARQQCWPESFCKSGKFLRQVHYWLKNTRILCNTKYPDNMQSVRMNWKVSGRSKKCRDEL